MVNTVFSCIFEYFWCDFQGDIRKIHGTKIHDIQAEAAYNQLDELHGRWAGGRNDPDGANNAFGVWATEVMMRVIIYIYIIIYICDIF
jgi:hypothetical protein